MKHTQVLLPLVLLYGAGVGIQGFQAGPAHKTVQLAGCLQKTAAEPGYMLTKAETLSRATPEEVSVPPSVGTSGNAPAANAGEAGLAQYELRPATGPGETGVNAKELQRHVGTRVEITARPVEQPSASPPSPQVITPQQQEEKPREPREKIRLTVTAITPLGSPCS